MSMKINRLEIENVKRIHAVTIEPEKTGLTIIGGNNRQGKTSVLDSIMWALGGNKYRPSNAKNADSAIPPRIKITMNNGLVVERKGKNSDLKVTDPTGRKGGQQLLDEFVEELAINMPKFMEASGKEKADTLLKIIGVGPQLNELDKKEKELYSERLYVGRTADQKEKFAKEQPYYPDAPKEPVSASDLIQKQQDILARNGQRQQWIRERSSILEHLDRVDDKIDELKEKLHELKTQKQILEQQAADADHSPKELEMESTEELESEIANTEEINRKVRANLDKEKAEEDAQEYRDQYTELTGQIEQVRQDRQALLDHADLPLPELSVDGGELIYKGQKWDNMSSAEQMIVSTSIIRKLNPECGFVLMDKLESMDMDTLKEFGDWLDKEGLQAIATRVSTGDECSIIITDGYGDTKAEEAEPAKKDTPKASGWTPGMGF